MTGLLPIFAVVTACILFNIMYIHIVLNTTKNHYYTVYQVKIQSFILLHTQPTKSLFTNVYLYEAKLPKLQAMWEEQGWAKLLLRWEGFPHPVHP